VRTDAARHEGDFRAIIEGVNRTLDATTDPMDVAVIGTGHVGLITAVAMSVTGHRVVATDVDDDKIARLTEGEPHFYEPGLEEALERQLASGRLRFSSDPSMTVGDAEVVFICVGTPPRADGEANLLAMETAASMIARHARRSPVVVEKSTVPAGTADRVRQTMVRDSGGTHFEIVSNPEFLREGSALHDSLHPDRIVVGGESEHALSVMRRLYEPITSQGCRLIEVDRATAELAKHTSNAFLALKISFANALARLSERAGADVTAIVDVMGSDPRIGPAFLSAGLGYGGFCFPKDVAALERLSTRLGYPFPLLGEVARLNDEAVEAVVGGTEAASRPEATGLEVRDPPVGDHRRGPLIPRPSQDMRRERRTDPRSPFLGVDGRRGEVDRALGGREAGDGVVERRVRDRSPCMFRHPVGTRRILERLDPIVRRLPVLLRVVPM
jgi:UDPglucose 6-dehydrogenase